MLRNVLLAYLVCSLTAVKSISVYQVPGRTFGGNLVASETAYPFAVYIYTNKGGSGSFGAGTIVTSNSILTSAKQLENGLAYEVGFGSHIKSRQQRQVVGPHNVICYPNYHPVLLRHNIAIIRLPKEIEFDSQIQPIQLARRAYAIPNYFAGRQGQIIGWGRYNSNQLFLSNTLRYLGVRIIRNAQCANTFAACMLIASSMCTVGYKSAHHNACDGDQGGPLLIQEGIRQGDWTQIGVISFGRGCPTQTPTGYASVAFYVDWIQQMTGVAIRD